MYLLYALLLCFTTDDLAPYGLGLFIAYTLAFVSLRVPLYTLTLYNLTAYSFALNPLIILVISILYCKQIGLLIIN